MSPQEIEKTLEEHINLQRKFYIKVEKEIRDLKLQNKRLERRVKNIELRKAK